MDRIKCIIVDDEPTAREVLSFHINNIDWLSVEASCSNAQEALSVLETNNIDLIFLDINMPGVSGISLAKSLQNKVPIILTTAYREYAIDGFDLQVIDYLLKPISFERFYQAVEKFRSGFQQPKNISDDKDFFFVMSDRKMTRVNKDEILYIESLNNYLKIHRENDVVITRESASAVEDKLGQSNFLRIHRSYIVNIDHVASYSKESVEIADKFLPVSRSYKEELMQKLNL